MKYFCYVICILFVPLNLNIAGEISGELKKWHKVTITFDGPQTSETATPNPFLHYRFNVTLTNGDQTYLIPGSPAAARNEPIEAANPITCVDTGQAIVFMVS